MNLSRIRTQGQQSREELLRSTQLTVNFQEALAFLMRIRTTLLETLERLKRVLLQNLPEERMRSLVDEYTESIRLSNRQINQGVEDINVAYDMLLYTVGIDEGKDERRGRRFTVEEVEEGG